MLDLRRLSDDEIADLIEKINDELEWREQNKRTSWYEKFSDYIDAYLDSLVLSGFSHVNSRTLIKTVENLWKIYLFSGSSKARRYLAKALDKLNERGFEQFSQVCPWRRFNGGCNWWKKVKCAPENCPIVKQVFLLR